MTLGEIKAKVKRDLDLEEETFITDDELNDIVNEGIKICEATIHGLYEDYFKNEACPTITQSSQVVSLPSDIYADKIRKVIYDDGVDVYEIRPIKTLTNIPNVTDQDTYTYDIVNPVSTGTIQSSKYIKLYPAARQSSTTDVTIHYIRRARELVNDTDHCDIPEFNSYIVQYAKVECLKKEKDFNAATAEHEKLNKLNELMIATLMNRKDDENNEVVMDFSSYSEQENI